jgi:WD40 repeat protein
MRNCGSRWFGEAGLRRTVPAVATIATLLAGILPSSGQQVSGGSVQLTQNIGHAGRVGTLAFSADGRFFASGGHDGMVKLWDFEGGRLLRSIVAHTAFPGVAAVAFTRDGAAILSGGSDTVKLWDAATGRLVHSFGRIDDDLYQAIATSPDGRFFVTPGRKMVPGGARYPLRVWDLRARRVIRTLDGHTGFARALAYGPDGKIIASAGKDKSIRLWDAGTGKLLRSLAAHTADIAALAFSPDGAWLASGGEDNQVTVWDWRTGRAAARLTPVDAMVAAVGFSPDGRSVWVGSWSSPVKDSAGRLRVYDRETGRLVVTPEDNEGTYAVAVAPTGDGVIAAGNSTLKRWRLDGTQSRDFQRFRPAYSLELSKDGRRALAGQADQAVLWDLDAGAVTQVFRSPGGLGAAMTPDGKRIAHGGGAAVRVHDRDAPGSHGVEDSASTRRMAFSPAGDRLVGSAWDGTSTVWDAGSGKRLRVHTSPSLPLSRRDRSTSQKLVNHLAYAPDGTKFVSAESDSYFVSGKPQFPPNLHLWDAETGRLIRSMSHDKQSTLAAEFSPDGKRLLSVGAATTGGWKLWDVGTGRLIRAGAVQPAVGADLTWAAAFSPDGRLFATGGATRLQIWNAESGQPVHTIGGQQAIFGLRFTPDSRRLISAASDGSLKIWDTRSAALVATLLASKDGEWLVITPEGFFAASANGAQLVHVVRGLQSAGIEQVYQALYRPDLVREKLAGDPQGKVREAASRLDLDKVIASGGAPRVTVAAGPATGGPHRVRVEQIEVTATIADQGGGVGRLEWRVNGVTAGVETRGFDRLATAPQAPAPLLVRRALSLSPGENVIEVVVYNAANLIASVPARLTVVREGAAQAAKPRLHVLAVGVNDYLDSRLRLTFATVDAKAIGEALRRSGSGLYESVELTALLDGDVTDANLERTFATLAGQIRPDDVFVFFLAGHGKTVDGRYHFLPQDFRYAGDESIIGRGIGQERWQEWFARIPARKSLLLYDTCESGSLTGERVATRGIERLAAVERLTRATGRTTLTASTDDAPALEGYRGHGVFSYALLDAFGRADGNGNGLVDVTELAAFVDAQVPEISFAAFRQRQFPQMKIVGSNFPVAPTAVHLPAGGEAAAPIPTRPTHVVITPADVYARAGAPGDATTRLVPGTLVTLVRSEQGWVLVAKDGKPLGYVAQNALVAAQ